MKFRLERLLRLRKKQRKQAEQQLSRLSRERIRQQDMIRQLGDKISDIDQRLQDHSRLASTSLWNVGSRNVDMLLQQIEQERLKLAEVESQYATMRQEYLRLNARGKSLERLRENHQHAQQQESQRQFQMSMDDFVLAKRHQSNK